MPQEANTDSLTLAPIKLTTVSVKTCSFFLKIKAVKVS